MEDKKRNIIVNLILIGIIHALMIVFVPPLLDNIWIFHSGKIHDTIILIFIPVMLALINVCFTVILLYLNPDYIKFRYAILPFLAWFFIILLLVFSGVYIKYIRIFVSGGALDLGGIGYFLMIIISCVINLMSSVVSYIILIKIKNKRKQEENIYEKTGFI